MSKLQIEVTKPSGDVVKYDFAPMEFGVAQACMLMLAARPDSDEVALWLVNDAGDPTLLTSKEEVMEAQRQQRFAQMQQRQPFNM